MPSEIWAIQPTISSLTKCGAIWCAPWRPSSVLLSRHVSVSDTYTTLLQKFFCNSHKGVRACGLGF